MNEPRSDQRAVRLLRESWPERPEMGPAISRVLLDAISAGEAEETIRLSRPGRVVAFGRQDVVGPGYANAVAAARAAGYEAMERLAGGRAALYFEGALSLTHTVPDPEPPRRTKARFNEICELLCEAFGTLGVDARIGEVPGEYCPGAYSVNAGGRVKLAGVGQRMIRGAAHVGAVIVVRDSAQVQRVLSPVYEALDLAWRPETTGAVLEEATSEQVTGSEGAATEPGDALAVVEEAILAALAARYELLPGQLEAEELSAAEAISDRYRSASSPRLKQ